VYLEKIQVNTDYLVNSEKDLLQLIIDCGASNLIDSQYRKDVDMICRDIIYTLHVKRAELLLEYKVAVGQVFNQIRQCIAFKKKMYIVLRVLLA
jgi:hypothetical protein